LGSLGISGISGIENQKPKNINCKLFLSFQAGNNYQIIIILNKTKLFFYFLFFSHIRADAGTAGEGGRGGGEGGRGGGEGGRGEGREVRPRGRECVARMHCHVRG
jgi:hypothetical protein